MRWRPFGPSVATARMRFRSSSSRALGRRSRRGGPRKRSPSRGSAARLSVRYSQRVKPRMVESIRATVASDHRRLAFATAATSTSSDRSRRASLARGATPRWGSAPSPRRSPAPNGPDRPGAPYASGPSRLLGRLERLLGREPVLDELGDGGGRRCRRHRPDRSERRLESRGYVGLSGDSLLTLTKSDLQLRSRDWTTGRLPADPGSPPYALDGLVSHLPFQDEVTITKRCDSSAASQRPSDP